MGNMTTIYIGAIIAFLGFLYLIMASTRVIKTMEKHSKTAIDNASSQHNVELDLSIESVSKVEDILKNLRTGNDLDINETAMLYGAYLGEVAINIDNAGIWVKDHPEMGNKSYAVKFPDKHFAFPLDWVKKYLSKADNESILYQFNAWKKSHDELLVKLALKNNVKQAK